MVSRQLQTSVLAVSLLVCCFTASAVKTGPSASSFAAFVQKLNYGKLTGYPEPGYGYGSEYGTESAEVCLSVIGHKNCRNNFDQSPDYYTYFSTAELGCCDDHKDSYKLIPDEPVPVVTCDTAGSSYWSNSIYILGGPDDTCQTTEVGTAKITCTFKESSDKCSGALCEGMVITADTTIYGTYGYTHTLPTPPKQDKDCEPEDGKKIGGSSNARSGPGFVVKADAPAKGSDSKSKTVKPQDYKHEEGVYAGWVYLYSGPITSVNGAKDHEWCGGWFEFTTQWEQAEVVDCPHNPWIKPQTLQLDLVKTKAEKKY